jgi:Lon protease-like protein
VRAEVALFPLRLVLFPGATLPLHIFEPRYRELVQSLVGAPEPATRHFGVVAIQRGRDVGAHPQVHDVGCLAVLREVTELEDGRFDIVCVGGARFRIIELHHDEPLLRADVELLSEVEVLPEADPLAAAGPPAGDGVTGDWMTRDATEREALRVAALFDRYLSALGEVRGAAFDLPALPDDPVVLSYVVSATAAVDLGDRQRLLAAPDGRSRLELAARMLRRETALLEATSSVPAADFAWDAPTPN